jgi:hypothetical protein
MPQESGRECGTFSDAREQREEERKTEIEKMSPADFQEPFLDISTTRVHRNIWAGLIGDITAFMRR